MGQFRYDAHPCGMLISSVAALGTFFPEANPALKGLDVFTKHPEVRDRQILRLLGKMPTIAAQSYRHRLGRPYNTPMSSQDLSPLSYTENFLYMLDRLSENQYRPHPTLVRSECGEIAGRLRDLDIAYLMVELYSIVELYLIVAIG